MYFVKSSIACKVPNTYSADRRIPVITRAIIINYVFASVVLCCVSATKESERRRKPRRHRTTAEQPWGEFNFLFFLFVAKLIIYNYLKMLITIFRVLP